MKAVILAGGLGTRMGDATRSRPKAMVEIGGQPLIWHLMRLCAAQGLREFIVAAGYMAQNLQEYFATLKADWTVECVDTGLETLTGGRVKRLASRLAGESEFLLTYADGLADIDLAALFDFHRAHGRLATVTAIPIPERYGRLRLDGDVVQSFCEKPSDEAWINGGFFVVHPKVVDRIVGDRTIWEREPLESLARDGELVAYRHRGFWCGMDSVKEHAYLERLWRDGEAPWKRE